MMTLTETRNAVQNLINDLQPARFNEGWINHHNFTLTVEASAHHSSDSRELVAKAITLGQEQFGKQWFTEDYVYYYEAQEASKMRNVLAQISKSL